MKWYFKIAGGHVHVRVFMNGAKCGDLCFRVEEWKTITTHREFPIVMFIDETQEATQ